MYQDLAQLSHNNFSFLLEIIYYLTPLSPSPSKERGEEKFFREGAKPPPLSVTPPSLVREGG